MGHRVKDGELYRTWEDWANAVIRSMCCNVCQAKVRQNIGWHHDPPKKTSG